MISYVRTKPLPRCKHCQRQMDFYVPGLTDSDHAHSECDGEVLVRTILAKYEKRRNQDE